MKKLLTLLTVLSLLLSFSASLAETYQGQAEGKNGPVTVELQVQDGKITQAEVTAHTETAGIADGALSDIPRLIVENQSLAIDAIAGATVTSQAVLDAARSAAEAAGLDVASLMAASVSEEAPVLPETESADVLVIGAGGAGLSAAAAAAQQGASVIVLEANGIVGGATIRSGGHLLVFDEAMNRAMDRNDEALKPYLDYDPAEFGAFAETLTTLQDQIRAYLQGSEAGRFESIELALIDHYLKGRGTDLEGNEATNDFALLDAAFRGTEQVNAWLRSGGMEFQDKMYNAHGGTPVGGAAALISTLQKMAEDAQARIYLDMRATSLLSEDGRVTGAVAEDSQGNVHTYHAKSVVLATGGFQSNPEMAARYQKIGTGLGANNASTSPKTDRGDGIQMAQELGAQLRDMGFMVTVMEGYHEGCSLGEFGKINAAVQLAVNKNGDRFADDSKLGGMGTAGSVSLNQPDGLVYFVGDSKLLGALEEAVPGFVDTMKARGSWFIVRDTLEEAISEAGLDVSRVLSSVEAYNTCVDTGSDSQFGRTKFNGRIDEGPFCVICNEAHYHLTFGGLVIDTQARVLDTNQAPIPGLYAAGDILSGLEGDAHQSGDCITTMLYYGKTAGENAAKAQ